MLEFRQAAAAGDLSKLKQLYQDRSEDFNINEPGPQSGKTAAHVAAERARFEVIYWLLEKGADFSCKDNEEKTAADYLQQKEFNSIGLSPMSKGKRLYYLCNAHYKIWLAHDPALFMPYLYQEDFRQYREKNPDGYMSLVYSEALLNAEALAELVAFAKKYEITLISFENKLKALTDQFGTKEDELSYQLASYELSHYPNQEGGNLAVVADLIRWSTVLLRMGNYSDTDVQVGQHSWMDSISMDKPVALNLGSLIYPDHAEMWMNSDIIVAASLFPRPHPEGNFRITLSKTGYFIIQQVQLSLLSNCQLNMNQQRRIMTQQSAIKVLSNLSSYLQDFFKCCGSERSITDNFTSDEITGLKANGLELFSRKKRASIVERMANLKRKKVEEECGGPEIAHKYSSVFKNVQSDEHEKFLINYMRAIQMSNIKEVVKQLSGSYVYAPIIVKCIVQDDIRKYSIYSNETIQSAFRSTNTVKFDTPFEENERMIRITKCADLSFTPFGMADVLKRSQDLKEEHKENDVLCAQIELIALH